MVPLMEVSSPLTGRRGVCLPFSDACRPLVFRPIANEMILEVLEKLARRRNWKHTEIRGPIENLPAADGKPSETYHSHELDLRDEEVPVEQRFSDAVRRAVRKSQRGGLQARISVSMDAVLDYYRLHVRTRRRHGLPPQPRSFFENISKQLIAKDSGFVVLAHLDGQAVAGAVFLRFGKAAVYKFGASDQAHWDLRPNNLVMWEAVRFLQANDAETLNFGRTSTEDEGLRRFKGGWGTCESTIPYWRFDREMVPLPPVHQSPNRLVHTLFGHFPLAVNRLAGALIYPHLD
jgi:CelD/BcsL family acetyltransferase involved in cellulose biosynthesis